MNALFTFLMSFVLIVNLPTTPITQKSSVPPKQKVSYSILKTTNDFIYTTDGRLYEILPNSLQQNRFYVLQQNGFLLQIQLTDDNTPQPSDGVEIGYLARVLAAESLTAGNSNNAYNISMFARTCIAETIRNRKNSQLGFFSRYNTYRDVILYTGYAINMIEFYDTYEWLRHPVALKRFVEEVLPVAVFVFYNPTNFTRGAIGFYTPAQMREGRILDFANVNSFSIADIDPHYEFTFWKF